MEVVPQSLEREAVRVPMEKEEEEMEEEVVETVLVRRVSKLAVALVAAVRQYYHLLE
jgi:hypothetical protein